MNWSFSQRSQVIVQGIGEPGISDCAMKLKAYGTNIVAGVSPGKSQTKLGNIPVFDLVEMVVTEMGAIETSLIFVPPYQVLDAGLEAIAAGIRHLIIFTTGVPPLDTIALIKYAKSNCVSILGPGSRGLIIPEGVWLGTLQPKFYQPGKVGLIGISPYLSYEVAWELNQAQIGQSIVVCLGEDKILGSNLNRWLSFLDSDANTQAIVLLGRTPIEVEEVLTCQRHNDSNKPLIIYLAGLQAPQEKLLRNAVTIITNHLSSSVPALDTNTRIIHQLKQAGMQIARKPCEIPLILKDTLFN
ncbi:succinate--CoA ligase subunit alpha [Myxosarcina sp. GI1(2024)]